MDAKIVRKLEIINKDLAQVLQGGQGRIRSSAMSKKKKFAVPNGIPESIPVTDTLDLHGFFPEQVAEIVDTFILNALDLKLSKLRIVHGKGKSRLKFEVHHALKNSPRVTAFYDAPLDAGGWGATIVEISSLRSSS